MKYKEFLESTPFNDPNKGFYKKYINSYKSSTLMKDKLNRPKNFSKSIGKSNSVMSENSSQDTFKKYWNQFFGK